jgi:hypothetical protein
VPIQLAPLAPLRDWSLESFSDFLRLLNNHLTTIGVELSRLQQLDVTDFTIANGRNNNLVLPNRSIVRLSGPTGAFSITGIDNGTPGRVLVLYNATSQNMTLSNESAFSDAENRIVTLTGSDLATTGTGARILFYDTLTPSKRWVVIGGQA